MHRNATMVVFTWGCIMAVSLAALELRRVELRKRQSRLPGALRVAKVLVAWLAAVMAAGLFVVAALSPAFLFGFLAAMAAQS
jgi:hypothetical protein